MSAPLVFIDTETTGLDPERHELWDIAVIGDGKEWNPHIRPQHLESADPTALRMTRFYERTNGKGWEWSNRGTVAGLLAELSFPNRHLVAAVPSFDADFLARFLRANGYREAWHYHLIDVETLAAGKLGLAPPWDSEELSRAVGIDPEQFERHTAIGDARWAKALYEAVIGERL